METEFETGVGTAETGEQAGRDAAADAFDRLAADRVDFATVFASPSYRCEAVIEGVRSVVGDAELVGATTEGKFTERGVHTSAIGDQEGVTVALIASDEMRFFTALGRDVSADTEASVTEAVAALPSAVDGYPHLTGLLLSSAVMGREELALLTYQQRPIPWAGGGANDLSLENLKVFVGDEPAADAVAFTLIASKRPLTLGVGNRHEPIGGSFEVTRAEGTVVYEIDGEPAYDVWKQAFEERAQDRYGLGMDEIERDRGLIYQAFTEMVFGLRTGDDEYKVRSPFLTFFFEPYDELGREAGDLPAEFHGLSEFPTLGTLPEGALQFEHPVPEGVVLYPMTSGREGTIDRGARSVRHAMADFSTDRVAGGLVFECPCGEATLQEEYHKLVEAVAGPLEAPIAGMQSGGGEVCLRQDDLRGVHETSTTVLLFPGGEAG